MDLSVIVDFLIIYILNIRFSAVSGVGFKYGHFQVIKKHPAMKKCADAILKTNDYVGVRVLKETGRCEGLPHRWLLNETIETNYAYAKKLSVKEVYEPPFKVAGNPKFKWKLPGVFQRGAQLDMSVTCVNGRERSLAIELQLTDHIEGVSVGNRTLAATIGPIHGFIHEFDGKEIVSFEPLSGTLPDIFSSNEVSKISFLAQKDSLTMLLKGKSVHKFEPSFEVATLSEIWIEDKEEENPVHLHSLQFTGN